MRHVRAVVLAWLVAVLSLVGSACYVPGPQHPTPSERAAIVEITGTTLTEWGPRRWTGTGTYIGNRGNTGLLVTAGHVCDGSPIVTSYTDENGAVLLPIYDHDTDADDTCIMISDRKAPAVIHVGSEPPAPGDLVSYSGYPSGSRGTFRGEVESTSADGRISVTIPVYFGASGSVLLNWNGEAVGILSTGDMRFHHHAWFIGPAALWRAYTYGQQYLADLYSNPYLTTVGTLTGITVHRD